MNYLIFFDKTRKILLFFFVLFSYFYLNYAKKNKILKNCQLPICPEGSKWVSNMEKVKPDGCSAGIFKVMNHGWTNCCNNHDICWGDCSKSQSFCDHEFKKCMLSVCKKKNKKLYRKLRKATCKLTAASWAKAVQLNKCRYVDVQKQFCKCSFENEYEKIEEEYEKNQEEHEKHKKNETDDKCEGQEENKEIDEKFKENRENTEKFEKNEKEFEAHEKNYAKQEKEYEIKDDKLEKQEKYQHEKNEIYEEL